MTNPNSITPESWTQEVQDSILSPQRSPSQVVVDADTIERFHRLDSRAKAHAAAKGEHEAMVYLSIYAIHNGALWRCEHDTWEDYCDEWDKTPFGISKSSIKHKVTDIRKLLAVGVTTDTIIRSLGLIPMATRALIESIVEEGQEGYVLKEGVLPEGQTVDSYLSEATELGPSQAGMAVDELNGRTRTFVGSAEYDADTQRILFAVITEGDSVDLFIPGVPQWASALLLKKLRGGR